MKYLLRRLLSQEGSRLIKTYLPGKAWAAQEDKAPSCLWTMMRCWIRRGGKNTWFWETIMHLYHRMNKYCWTVKYLWLVCASFYKWKISLLMRVPCMTKHCGAYTILKVAKESKINCVCLKAMNLYWKRQPQLRSTRLFLQSFSTLHSQGRQGHSWGSGVHPHQNLDSPLECFQVLLTSCSKHKEHIC